MDDLSARLRQSNEGFLNPLHIAAADALDSLTRERDEARTERDRLTAERDEWKAKVADLRRPPRGIGPQVVTVADCNPTYGDLLASYHALQDEMLGSVGKLTRERDELAATVERLERALTAMEQAFDRLNEPDPIWMVDDSYEHRATGAAIVRNAARAVLADTEEVGDRG